MHPRSSWLAVPFVAAAFIGLGMGPASADPGVDGAHGQVERGLNHSNSICAASGLNDVPLDPVEGGRVQSYGQIVRVAGVQKFPGADGKVRSAPGNECNAHLMPWPEGFGPPPAP